jgi:hypothetical protein
MSQTQVLESLGQSIPAQYDYMDTLPLEGWMWEFIRRNGNYKILHEECKKPETKYKEYLAKLGQLADFALKPNYFSSNLDKSLFFVKFAIGIPNPKVSYNMFGDTKPDIIGFTSIIPFKPQEEDLVDGSFSERHSSYILNAISPSAVSDTLYIGIDTKADINFIKKELDEKILKRYLMQQQNTRVRVDKWKYYLIAYDLRCDWSNVNVCLSGNTQEKTCCWNESPSTRIKRIVFFKKQL